MAGPHRAPSHGILALSVFVASVAVLTLRAPKSAAFERPVHFSILVLIESGLALWLWARRIAPWKLASVGFPRGIDDSRWRRPWSPAGRVALAGMAVDAVRGALLRPSLFLVLIACIAVRTVLYWRVVRTIHCSWTSFEPFLPFAVTLFSANQSRIQLPQSPTGAMPRWRSTGLALLRYLAITLVWACAARSLLSLADRDALTGAICTPGPFRWERLVPVMQGLGVALDAILITYMARIRQDDGHTTDDDGRSVRFVGRVLLAAGCVVTAMAFVSFYNGRNLRWAFLLHDLELQDLVYESVTASITLVSLVYLLGESHSNTLMLALSGTIFYVQYWNLTMGDDNLYTVHWVVGLVALVSFCAALNYEADAMVGSRLYTRDHALAKRLLHLSLACVIFFILSIGIHRHPYEPASLTGLAKAAQQQSDRWISQANTSATLTEATAEYRLRHGLPPPPNFDKWFEFARMVKSPIVDDFTQIDADLRPFWGIEPQELRRMTNYVLQYPWLSMGGLRIRGGKVEIGRGVPGTHMWMMEAMRDMIEPFAQHLPDLEIAMNLNDECRVAVPFEDMRLLHDKGTRSKSRLAGFKDLAGFQVKQEAMPDGPWPTKLYGSKTRSSLFTNRIRSPIYYDFVAPTCPSTSLARTSRWWSRRATCRYCAEPHTDLVRELASSSPVVTDWNHAGDICHQPDQAYLNGFLFTPAAIILTRAPFPVFSQSRVGGFADVLIPSPWNFAGKAMYDETKDVPWEKKQRSLFWRGSTSDGYAAHGAWESFLRARFVWATRQLGMRNEARSYWLGYRSDLADRDRFPDGTPLANATFVGPMMKCHTNDCLAEKSTFWGMPAGSTSDVHAGPSPIEFQDHWQHAHLMDLDGAGFSGRLIPFLRSRSLTYRSGLFRSWFEERVHPWVHFIPVDTRLRELWDLVRFLGWDAKEDGRQANDIVKVNHGHKLAKQIADAGRDWTARALRKEDMQVYMFRLLLEWGRLVHDRREELGFVESGVD